MRSLRFQLKMFITTIFAVVCFMAASFYSYSQKSSEWLRSSQDNQAVAKLVSGNATWSDRDIQMAQGLRDKIKDSELVENLSNYIQAQSAENAKLIDSRKAELTAYLEKKDKSIMTLSKSTTLNHNFVMGAGALAILGALFMFWIHINRAFFKEINSVMTNMENFRLMDYEMTGSKKGSTQESDRLKRAYELMVNQFILDLNEGLGLRGEEGDSTSPNPLLGRLKKFLIERRTSRQRRGEFRGTERRNYDGKKSA